MFLIRTDLSGDVLWQRTYGTPAWDLCMDLQVTSDGFALAGTSYLNNEGDAYVVRTDFNGDTLWTRMIGGGYFDEALGVALASDNGLVVVGATTAIDDNIQAFVAKLNDDGGLAWFESFGGDSLDYFRSAVETADGGLACSGGTKSDSDVKQVLIVKVDANGNTLWQEQYGSMGDSEGREIQENANGDLAVASYNSYANAGGKDMVLFLVSSSGAFMLGKNYGGLGDEEGASLEALPDGGYIIAGTAEDYGPGLRSIFVVRCDETGETADDTVYEMFDPLAVHVQQLSSEPFCFPNPTTGLVTLGSPASWSSMALYDATGRRLHAWSTSLGTLDLSGLNDGAYFLRGTDRSGRIVTAPLILQKH
ncbi:MAG: T9SS type A sorting domain-containing protein [Flavobacteriales bacterium]